MTTASQYIQQACAALMGLATLLDGKFTATRQEVLLAKYGLTCTVSAAMKELGKGRHAVNVMLDDGRLTRLGKSVDVVSIAAYLEDAKNHDFRARVARKKKKPARTAIHTRASEIIHPKYSTTPTRTQGGDTNASAQRC